RLSGDCAGAREGRHAGVYAVTPAGRSGISARDARLGAEGPLRLSPWPLRVLLPCATVLNGPMVEMVAAPALLAHERNALRVIRRQGGGEGRLDAGVRHRLEAGGELDERRLAEGGAHEAHAERQAEDGARRDLDVGIAADGGDVRAAEREAVGVVEVGGPGEI